MKNILLTIFIFTACNNAFADWVKVASSTDDDLTVYISSESITIKSDIRTAWAVMNTSQVAENGSMSSKFQQEYDCKSNKVRMLQSSLHTEHFGRGTTLPIKLTMPTKWQVIPNGSIATYTKNYICGK
jgi:hypothetical protein